MRAIRHHGAIEQLSARPILIVYSIALALATGNAPGRARQTGQVCVLGAAPKSVAQPQNIFDAVPSSTWVSRPITGSYRAMTSAYVMT